jgi:hypothetical protein
MCVRDTEATTPYTGVPLATEPGIFLERFIAQKIQRDTQGYKIVHLTNLS